MGKSPLILAALASDAVPGLVIKKATALSGDGTGNFDAAVITDEAGEHYIVRMPNSPAAGTELELELKVIKSLSSFGARLGFEVPKPIGETRDSVGNRVMIFKFVYGNKIDAARVAPASNLSLSIARAIAGIHSLPLELVQSAGLPEFSPAENIRARVAELDRAAQTGKVPSVLLSRWEQALEDVTLFRYQPTVIHGALSGDAMLEQDHNISGVIDWKNLQINDPALDFAWLIPSGDQELIEAVLLNYQLARSGSDANIARRATLYSELELAKWLLHGYTRRDAAVVEDAVQMLQDLAELATAGELIPLTQSQTPQPPVAAFVPEVVEETDIETVTVVSSSWSLEESGEVDDSTKPIPTQRDDLF
ncbi:MAG: phosphotransferase [Micrococcales bacterium]